MQEVATFLPLQCKFANLGAHIAAGDSQAAVSFPTESEGISTFSERQLQSFLLLLQLVVTAGSEPSIEGRYGGHILPEGR